MGIAWLSTLTRAVYDLVNMTMTAPKRVIGIALAIAFLTALAAAFPKGLF